MKWLCYCEGLRVERNFVCGFEQVLPDRSHRQLGVGFCDPEVAGAVQAEEALHGAKTLLDPEASFGNEFVERHCQLAVACGGVQAVVMKIPAEMPRLKGYRFPREVVAYAVWVYHRFALSTADVEDLLAERGVIVSR